MHGSAETKQSDEKKKNIPYVKPNSYSSCINFGYATYSDIYHKGYANLLLEKYLIDNIIVSLDDPTVKFLQKIHF